MNADYAGAEVLEAKNYGYSQPNHPRAWCLHTSEGFGTAQYFHTTTRQASTHYVIEQSGKVWQCVPESEGAYANAVEGKPYPAWADPHVNLNLQTIGVEIEGHAATITETMPRGSAQWNALVALMADRCAALGIPPENTIGHYQVSTSRSDPGALDIGQVVADVQQALDTEVDDMTPEESERLTRIEKDLADVHQWLFSSGWNPPNESDTSNHAAQIAARLDATAQPAAAGGVDYKALAKAVADEIKERLNE